MSTAGQIKVAIDVHSLPGIAGGAAVFVGVLISGLGQLTDGPESYVLVVQSKAQADWLKPFTGANQNIVIKPSRFERADALHGNSNGHITFPGLLKRALGPLLPAARYFQGLLNRPFPQSPWPEVPVSDGFYESLGCDVIHFPTQSFVLCAIPTVYNPHDLQHLHYPQFCTSSAIAWRETIYPAGCHFARTVVVGSQWAKDDIIHQYRIDPRKVQVIPEGPLTELHPKPSPDFLTQVKHKYQLEQPFALYPAVTWPHKNHIRLLEALAYLRDKRGLLVRLVCTGSLFEEFWPRIKQSIDDLKLSDQVKFLGFIPERDLRAVYHLSQFLIEPTFFEACSSPVFEAWLEGVPVTCSNVTALPDQVLDAGLLFDPSKVESIADAIEKVASDMELKRRLRERGYQRLKDFDWGRTTKAYRAVYRRSAGYPLTDEDRWLLTWDWMKEPEREGTGKL